MSEVPDRAVFILQNRQITCHMVYRFSGTNQNGIGSSVLTEILIQLFTRSIPQCYSTKTVTFIAILDVIPQLSFTKPPSFVEWIKRFATVDRIKQ